MHYSGDEIPAYRSRFDRSPRRSVRRIYDLKTIDLANTPSGARRSATWSRVPTSRGTGYTGYGTGYNSGYNGYNTGYDSGGASHYNFGNHVPQSYSSRNLGPESLRRSWSRPFGSLLAEAEADLSTLSHARSRLFKMADDALSVLNAIRDGFNSPFEPRSRQRWGLDDLFGPGPDDDLPPPHRYRSPIVMEDCIKRTRPRWSDEDAELFATDSSVNTLRRSPMPSTAEVMARLETPTDFPPFKYGGRLSADDWSAGRTDPTRTYYRLSDKPRDLDELRSARRQYFETPQNDEGERNVPISVDADTPTVRIDAPAPPAQPPQPAQPAPPAPPAPPAQPSPPPAPSSVKIPVMVESESAVAPTPVTTSTTQVKDDAKWSGRDLSFSSPETFMSTKATEVSNERCSKLEEENSRLRDLIHNVTEINRRWETFSSEREAYINELRATIDRQQEQLNQCLELLRLGKAGHYEGQRENSFQHSASYEQLKERLCDIIEPKATEEELSKLQEEVARLQKRLDETKKEHSELVGAYHQVKPQNGGSEESKETSTERSGFQSYRSLSRESNSKPDTATESAENTNKFFTTISASSSTSTVTHEDHRPTAQSPLSPSRDADFDNQSVCSKYSDKSESKLSDRRNVADRDLFKYAFDGANLKNRQEDVYGKRHSSPADGLSPTPTPLPGATRYVPLEVSCSASSLASAVPLVSIPPSSRDSSVDRDISICSDATIDCSPPSPIPVTVGYDADGLATVTTFRTVPIVREASPDRKSDDSGDSVKSVIETKSETVPRPTTFVEEEDTCSLVSPRGVLARATSTHGASVDGEGNGSSWSSDVFSRRLSADTVSCPKCGNTYPPSKYMQLMIHLDNCRTATGSPGVTLQELALSAINHLMNS